MLTKTDLYKMKQNQEIISMVTAYDYPSARLAEEADVDMILVGDSLGMVALGYSSTVQVTMDDMLHHAKAARRGAEDTFIVVDMPFMSYHISIEESLKNAQQLFQETNVQALKLEGASPEVLDLIRRLTDAGIPVISHLGLTPQSVNVLGGYKVQGKDQDSREQLKKDSLAVQQHGAMGLVLECIPKDLAKEISNGLTIPTIGIGSGVHCDGQVIVYNDLMKYGVSRLPKFAKPYANFSEIGKEAIKSFITEVKQKTFPLDEHSF